jgi:hypothetical protein
VCHTSSSGKPLSANAPHRKISTPPSGARQSSAMRSEVGTPLPVPSTIAVKPPTVMPNSPIRIG